MCLQENHQGTPFVFLQMTKWIFSVTKFANSLPKKIPKTGVIIHISLQKWNSCKKYPIIWISNRVDAPFIKTIFYTKRRTLF